MYIEPRSGPEKLYYWSDSADSRLRKQTFLLAHRRRRGTLREEENVCDSATEILYDDVKSVQNQVISTDWTSE